jgi:hypothetical protein
MDSSLAKAVQVLSIIALVMMKPKLDWELRAIHEVDGLGSAG